MSISLTTVLTRVKAFKDTAALHTFDLLGQRRSKARWLCIPLKSLSKVGSNMYIGLILLKVSFQSQNVPTKYNILIAFWSLLFDRLNNISTDIQALKICRFSAIFVCRV